jgi:hypothetical protein
LNLIRVMPAKGQDFMKTTRSEFPTGPEFPTNAPANAPTAPRGVTSIDTHDLRAGDLR